MSASAVIRSELMQKSINLTREMAPNFIGTPKVIIHPGAMSLDHPILERDGCTLNCASLSTSWIMRVWSCSWKTCPLIPGISAGNG